MPVGLTISNPVKSEVSNTYKQYLKLNGKRVTITIPEFFRESGLKFNRNGNMTSVLIPLDDGTRNSLSSIESFVTANVGSEKYKPLWLKEAMLVNVSHWCNYVQINSDGSQSMIQPGTLLGRGFYSMVIHASHVYNGPHKGGETHSLSLHVLEISYKPGEEIVELIDCQKQNFDGAPEAGPSQSPPPCLFQFAEPTPKKKTKKASRARKNKSDDQINWGKTVSPTPAVNGNVL